MDIPGEKNKSNRRELNYSLVLHNPYALLDYGLVGWSKLWLGSAWDFYENVVSDE